MLIVSFSSRISPFTSTVIFLLRSPLATAVVTSAMFRTCAVRFDAIEFTLSVRFFHVPETPGTSACPPSLPSAPTSRATRVTSLAKPDSWSTIVFTILPVRRNSPRIGRPSTSRSIFCERSPWATAPITRSTSLTGWPRSKTSSLTALMASRHPPVAPRIDARSESRPFLPTSSATRPSSAVNSSFCAMTALRASAMRPAMPLSSTTRRVEKSPLRTAVSTLRSARGSIPGSTGAASALVACGVLGSALAGALEDRVVEEPFFVAIRMIFRERREERPDGQRRRGYAGLGHVKQ